MRERATKVFQRRSCCSSVIFENDIGNTEPADRNASIIALASRRFNLVWCLNDSAFKGRSDVKCPDGSQRGAIRYAAQLGPHRKRNHRRCRAWWLLVGLGLSITHGIIVKQHSGSIEVDTLARLQLLGFG
jgi:hypothetical protein